MKITSAIAVGISALSLPCLAASSAVQQAAAALEGTSVRLAGTSPTPKAASAQSLGSRATTTETAALYGSFALTAVTNVYILVRGNSLGTLGVTQDYLDLPRVRLFNQQGQDLVTDGQGIAGFNFCDGSNATLQQPVINYYQNVRAAPVHADDACIAAQFQPGVYTFQVLPTTGRATNSVPPSGEVLFEVTFNP